VRVRDERTLEFPDYPGNNMFNTLGNLLGYPRAVPASRSQDCWRPH
jgi:hypothetical protein